MYRDMILTTSRICLRELVQTDFEDLKDILQDPEGEGLCL